MASENDPITERLNLAREIILEAGELTLQHFRNVDLVVDRKQDASPVTVADRGAEQLLRDRITTAFPEDGIVGEEFSDVEGTSPYRWILDPIDGTKSFISGVPLYGSLVGIEQGGKAVAGVIHIPALGETVYAATGQGAWYVQGDQPPVPARVSSCATLSESLFCTTQVSTFLERESGQGMAAYEQLESAARLTRTWGDCYGYLLLATGRAEVMIDPVINIWDAAAVQPVVEEAGGTFTDWQGEATIHHQEGIATNGHVLEEVLEITRWK